LMLREGVEEQANVMYRVLTATRSLLLLITKFKKPTDQEVATLFVEALALINLLNTAPSKSKKRGNVALTVIYLISPAIGCLFSNNCGVQLVSARKSLDDYLGKAKGFHHILSIFIETADMLITAIDNYMEEKHHKGGLAWTGSLDFDPSLKIFSSIHGHQALLTQSPVPSKVIGNVFSKQETWACHFWCPERGPLACEPKERDCSIIGCVSSDISIKGKAGHVQLEGCINTTVSISEALGTVTIIRCSNVEVVCGVVSTIVIEETNGCKLVLSEGSIDADISGCAISNLTVVSEDVETVVPTKIMHQLNGVNVVSSM